MPPTNTKKQVRAIRARIPSKLDAQFDSLAEPLTNQDAAILGYLTTVSDPFIEHPTGVPLIMGAGGLITEKSRVKRTFTVQCNSSGFGFLMVGADGWSEGSVNHQYASYNGGTGGKDVWYTSSSFVGTTVPVAGTATAVTGLEASNMPLVDASWDDQTQYRMVAMGLRVWPDSAAQTTSGDMYVCSTNEPYTTAAEGAIQGATESSITGINNVVMAVQSYPLPGWVSGKVVSTFAVPTQQKAFDFNTPPATGEQLSPYAHIAVIVTGATAGQTLKVEVSKIFEFEFEQSNRVDNQPEPTLSSTASDLMDYQRYMHPYKVSPPRPVHATTGIHNGAGPMAFADGLMVKRPLKLPALSSHVKTAAGNAVKTAAGHGLKWLAQKASSFLPGVLGKMVNSFASAVF